MESEEWRAIRGYEGIYEVSDRGRVRSLPREDAAGNWRSGNVLSPGQDLKKGYLNVGLSKNREVRHRSVHSLVAEAFIGLRPPGTEVSHKDHDPVNNFADNLEYVTHAENMKHSAEVARMGKLEMSDVQDIREIYASDPRTSPHELAAILDITPQQVANIARAKSYIHVANRDGTAATPLETKTSLSVDDILELQSQGYTIPEIAKMHDVEYSTPYQALRRAGIHQPGAILGTGRAAAKRKQQQAIEDSLPLCH